LRGQKQKNANSDPSVVHISFDTTPQTVEKGDKIAIHYVGTLEDGEQFDSSRERGEPISFTVGGGMMIPGFDNGVMVRPPAIRPRDIFGVEPSPSI
jgi:FKBP-type peptidyl-prolyl cis-trans isomerase